MNHCTEMTGVAVLRLESFVRIGEGVAAQGGIGNWLTAIGERVPRLVAVLPVIQETEVEEQAGREGVWIPRQQDVLIRLPEMRGYWRVVWRCRAIVDGLWMARKCAGVLICRVPEHGNWLTLPLASLLGFRLVLWVVADRVAARRADRLRRTGLGARLGRLVNRTTGWVEGLYLRRCQTITNGLQLAGQVQALRGDRGGVRQVVSTNLRRSDVRRIASRPEPQALPTALYVGRIAPEKGLLDLLRAWSIVRKHPAGKGAVLHLIGWSSSGEGPRLSNELGALGLRRDAVVWHPPIPFGEELFDWYRRATVFVLPSHTEGTPRVIAEALTFGVPVVATDAGSTAEMLRAGELGVVVPVGQPDALAAGILELFGDPERRRVLSTRGHAMALHWSVETVADEFGDVLQELGVGVTPRPRSDNATDLN